MKKAVIGAIASAALQFAIVGPVGATQLGYNVLDLGDAFEGFALNDSGQVAGIIHVHADRRAFLTGPDGIGGQTVPRLVGDTSSVPNGVNNAGQVTGYSFDRRRPETHVFVTTADGSPQSLGIGIGFDINNLGQVTGILVDGGMFLSGVNGEPLKFLGRLPGSTYALPSAVNDLGQVAGESGVGLSNRRAFVSNPAGGALKEVGAPGKERSASDVTILGRSSALLH